MALRTGRRDETHRGKIKTLDEGVDEADRVVAVHIIVDRFRKQKKLVARESRKMSHA